MDNWRLHPSGSQLDNLVKGPACLTSCQWDLGQCALEFRTSREEENMKIFFLGLLRFSSSSFMFYHTIAPFSTLSLSESWVNGAPYIGFNRCSSGAAWKGTVRGRPNARVFKVGWFSGLSGTRRHNDHVSLCERRRAVTQKRSRRAERAPPSTRHGEENGTHSLVPGSRCMSARWSLHSRTFFEDGVLRFQRCLKSSAESQGGPLFRCLPLLFMRRVWCRIKDELVNGGGTRRVTVQGFTASLSDCLNSTHFQKWAFLFLTFSGSNYRLR